MKLKDFLTEEVGKAFIPTRLHPIIRDYFLKAGITDVPYRLFGIFFWVSVLMTSMSFIFKIYPWVISREINILLQFIAFFASFALVLGLIVIGFISAIYFYVDIQIFNRTQRMEAVLQDFLRFVSENLRGGMPFERALWTAIRPEFGVLANEVRLVAEKVMTGQDIEDALKEFTDKYGSPMLRRSFDLIVEGMKGGGKIADLIDRIVENIEDTKELKSEMATTNLTYIIFVTFVVVVIAPLLFTLSYQFLTIIQSFAERLGTMSAQTVVALPIDFSNIKVKPQTFINFSRYALIITAVCSSMIVSMIQRGSIKAGVKYIPLFLLGSLTMFQIFSIVASRIVSGVFV
jgi:type II secretory pathway component PulF